MSIVERGPQPPSRFPLKSTTAVDVIIFFVAGMASGFALGAVFFW